MSKNSITFPSIFKEFVECPVSKTWQRIFKKKNVEKKRNFKRNKEAEECGRECGNVIEWKEDMKQ